MKCIKQIYENWSSRNCTREATHGQYCKQHSPDGKAARDEKSMAAYAAKRALWKVEREDRAVAEYMRNVLPDEYARILEVMGKKP